MKIQTIVKAFAKQHGISETLCQIFADDILQQAGMKTSSEPKQSSEEVRDIIRKQIKVIKGMTYKQLAEFIHCNPVTVNNALHAMEKAGEMYRKGYEHIEGKRGKPATIWGNKKQVIEGKEKV